MEISEGPPIAGRPICHDLFECGQPRFYARLPCAILAFAGKRRWVDPMNSELNPLLGFVPLLLISIPLAFVLYFLAKKKGQNAPLYFVLGLLPLVNGFATVYLVGAPDLALHAKMDRLLSEVNRIVANQTVRSA